MENISNKELAFQVFYVRNSLTNLTNIPKNYDEK